ncbi:MAG: hypothetical protein ACLFRB_10210 [Thiohalorhabdus sp.]|uniref:hypothetical protein n=1 Tax=Thiohalorhabdus sp. TaxID=3094134 RepID=UPI003980309A
MRKRRRPGPLFRPRPRTRGALPRWRLVPGLLGAGVAGLPLLWVLVGLLPGVPSVGAAVGPVGLRVVAAVIVAGLLLASAAFADF